MSDLWNKGEPPRDRVIVIMGNIVFRSDDHGYSQPVLCEAQWSEDDQNWLRIDGMSIRECSGEELIIHFWADLPLASAPSLQAHKAANPLVQDWRYFVTAKYGSEIVLARFITAATPVEAASKAERLVVLSERATSDDFAAGRARITSIAEHP